MNKPPSDMENASIKRVDPSALKSDDNSKESSDSSKRAAEASSDNGSKHNIDDKSEGGDKSDEKNNSSDKSSDKTDKSSSKSSKSAKLNKASKVVNAAQNLNGVKASMDDEAPDANQAPVQKGAKARKTFKQIVKAAPAVSAVGAGAYLFYMLKALALALSQMFMAAVHAAAGFFAMIGAKITSAISSFATAIGVTFTTAAAIATGGAGAAIISVTLVVAMVMGQATMLKDEQVYQSLKKATCSTTVTEAAEDLDLSVEAEERAKKIYKALSDLGMPDINIAAVLGNFQTESGGFDSTCVEGVYDEPYRIGERKAKALDNMDNWCTNYLFPMYSKNGVSCSQSGYKSGEHYYCGIGIVQWTGGGALKIMKKAESLSCDWYDFDFQMAYIISQPAPTGNAAFKDGIATWKEPAASTDEAAFFFSKNYEGNITNGQDSRRSKTAAWYKKITEEYNQSSLEQLGSNITAFLKKLSSTLYEKEVGEALNKCAMSRSINGATGTGQLGFPTPEGYRKLSAYYPSYSSGEYHSGCDFPCPKGTDIYAAEDGEVIVSVDKETSYGHYIVIKHSDNLYTIYGHNTTRLVEVGDHVVRGELIAKSGSTGNSTGPHCHFTVLTSYQPQTTVNPLDYLNVEELEGNGENHLPY